MAEGLTNREAAEKLCVSPRTVQGHLLKVFSKLDLSSRRELREAVRRRG
ncbi:MAG: LuxR C-terminal-related transcriptional regulator [Actinobacteria bacterium]|nr:LuxR C-terminal-related transcriptional regulator [Actinomycetota bacterium]